MLVLLVAGEAVAVVALHRLGGVDGFAIPRHDLGPWLQQSTSEEVLLAGVRLAALVAAWWLLGSTLLYVGALTTLLVGWRTRASAAVAWTVHVMLGASGTASTYGVDQWANIALFYCLWAPVGDTWSADRADRKPAHG